MSCSPSIKRIRKTALQRERITLAFLVALQHVSPTQRAILHLREVLEWPAVELVEWLNLSVPAVNSGLQRARRALRERNVLLETPTALPTPQLQSLLVSAVHHSTFMVGDVPCLGVVPSPCRQIFISPSGQSA